MSGTATFRDDLRICLEFERPLTRLAGILDAVGHELRVPERLQQPVCDWYDRRLIGDAA